MKNSIKEWYQSEYKDDELGEEIYDFSTFEELKENIPNVYDYLGVYDSIVRERVFSRLSEIMNVDYDVIYTEWLNN